MDIELKLMLVKNFVAVSGYLCVIGMATTLIVTIYRRINKKPFWKIFIIGSVVSVGILLLSGLLVSLFVIPELYNITGR